MCLCVCVCVKQYYEMSRQCDSIHLLLDYKRTGKRKWPKLLKQIQVTPSNYTLTCTQLLVIYTYKYVCVKSLFYCLIMHTLFTYDFHIVTTYSQTHTFTYTNVCVFTHNHTRSHTFITKFYRATLLEGVIRQMLINMLGICEAFIQKLD